MSSGENIGNTVKRPASCLDEPGLQDPNVESNEDHKKLRTANSKGIIEQDVGITTYVSPGLPGFRGLLKQRYTDFQVNEISPSGQVVHLTDLGAIEPRKGELAEFSSDSVKETKPEAKHEVDHNGEEGPPNREITVDSPIEDQLIKIDASHYKELLDIFDEAFVKQCIELASDVAKDRRRLETANAFLDKTERTKIHQLIREAFNGKLATSTTADNKFCITSSTPAKSKRRSSRKSKNAGGTQEFLHFTLYKENRDTMEAVALLGRFLRVPNRALSFAGTKDRRAVTTQRVCLHRGNIGRLVALNNGLPGAIRIGDFTYEKTPLRLGDLKGNQFWIVVRDLAGDPELSLTSLKNNGFVNYFGLQRFGTFSVSTHTLGRAIMRKDYDAVVAGVLEPQAITLPESREARELWATTKDASATLDKMPSRCAAECAILNALKESPSSLNAILRIPRNLKTMYLHAYQSYVWNLAASHRVNMGLTIQPGDMVLEDNVKSEDERSGFVKARHVTAGDIADGHLSIYDIVLPTPGFDVEYPNNLRDLYKTILQEDDINIENIRHDIREFSLSGGYRPLLARPTDVDWWYREYESPDDQIVYTDKDTLNDATLSKVFDSIPDGSRKALILRLSLASSQYATMALREAMKADTGRHGDIYFS